jgi:hypothetical protein
MDSVLSEKAEYKRGAKAGLLAGAVHGLILGVVYLAIWQSPKYYDIMVRDTGIAQPNLNPTQVGNWVFWQLVSIPPTLVLERAAFGVILGLVFGGVSYRFMRSHSLQVRALVFGAMFFSLELAAELIEDLTYYDPVYLETEALACLAASVVFGYLLAYFFARLGRNNPGPFSRKGANGYQGFFFSH